MNASKKNKYANIHHSLQPRSLAEISHKTGNIYESIAVISRRANQISSELRREIQDKIQEFSSSNDGNLQEVHENREQIEISKYYERLPHPALLALKEFLDDDLEFRFREVEEKDK
ncbi:MAG: DNA-directed RNA polymerase subunit omega [Chitinophagales bacterium]|nr:DNA-directed RNA polymerase subunit omega [Bacteroidota bacterium]MCB9043656.1 DNA-directed RNA polymerase subunit omega [Chitinophagales bacterium]